MLKLNFDENGNLNLTGDLVKVIAKEEVAEKAIKFSNGVVIRISYFNDIKIIEQHVLKDPKIVSHFPKQENNGDRLLIDDEIDSFEISPDLGDFI